MLCFSNKSYLTNLVLEMVYLMTFSWVMIICKVVIIFQKVLYI